MKIFKKLVVAATAATMIFGTVSSAFAAVNVGGSAFADVDADDKAAEAFNVLAALGVYQGNEGIGGNVRPDSTITREEFSAVVVRFLDKESTAKSLNTYVPSFTDANSISSWAWGYVNVASSLGIVNGYPNGEFRPQNPVTHAEAIAMLTRAVNVDKAATGVWPLNYVVLGGTVGITDGVDIVANVPATRAEVAMLTYNAYGVEHEWNSDKEKLEKTNKSFGTRDTDVRVDAKVKDVTQTSITFENATEAKHNGKHNWAATAYVLGVSRIDDLVDLTVNAYLNKDDEVVAVVVDTEDETVADGVLDTKKLKDGQLVIGSTRYRNFADNVTLYVNNERIDYEDDHDTVIEAIQAIKLWDNRTLGADSGLNVDTRASVTLDKDDNVSSVRITVWNIDGLELSDYDEDDEVITVSHPDGDDFEDLKITKSSKISINGKKASFKDLVEAVDEFVDEYDEDPVVYVATVGGANADDEEIYELELRTDIIKGDAVSYGKKGGDYYLTVRVDGKDKEVVLREQYGLINDGDALDDTDLKNLIGTVTLLIDLKDRAVKVLDSTGDIKDFFAILSSYRVNSDNEVTQVTVKNGNGDTVSYNVDKDEQEDIEQDLENVADNAFKRIGYFTLKNGRIDSASLAVDKAKAGPPATPIQVVGQGQPAPYSFKERDAVINEVKSNTIKIDDVLYAIADSGVLVFDIDKDEQIQVSQLRKNWKVGFSTDSEGAIALIVVHDKK